MTRLCISSDRRPRSGRDELDDESTTTKPSNTEQNQPVSTQPISTADLFNSEPLASNGEMATVTLTRAPLPSSSSTSSAPSPPRKKRANSRQQAWHDGADKQQGRAKSRKPRAGGVKKDPPPLIRKVGLAAQIYGIQGVMGTVGWFQGWREWLYPPNGGPDIVKAYECRPGMGVRCVC